MASLTTTNLLPSAFRTDTNKKFLNATLDQLYSKPDLRKINAYVGRTFAPTFKSTDNYQPEPTAFRQNYQLEPSIVVKDTSGNLEFFSSYIDLLQQIQHYGGITNNQSRMFAGESYSFDGLFDFDKFVNFNQYYWLANGPDAVQVYSSELPFTATYEITRDTTTGSYHVSGYTGVGNPTLRLAHGGTYQFVVNQPGHPFWIQSDPGTSGVKPNQGNFSSRNVLGVTNNGVDVGTITFTVPLPTAQDFYVRMPTVYSADFATSLHWANIQGQTLSSLVAAGGIDGEVNQLVGRSIIFINDDIDDSLWTQAGSTVPLTQRRSVWTIRLVDSTVADPVMYLDPTYSVTANQKVYIKSGMTAAEQFFYLNADTLIYDQVPDITAPLPAVYYQDGIDSSYVGQIKLLDVADTAIDVASDIVGQTAYQSPNGVSFTNGLKVQFDSTATPSTYAGQTFYVEGVGTSIQLIDVSQLVTPEAYAGTLENPDYITINRASIDQNPWSRSNRWFHVDVITATAAYNQVTPIIDQNYRANRPIIEFEPNLQLFNFGRVAKLPVDILDFTVTDAKNTIELSTSYTLDGVALAQGQRVIFANDFDPTVRNQIYVVNIVTINGQQVINLVPAADYQVLPYNNIVVMQGNNAGNEYQFNGTTWTLSQQKTAINQSPLFDIIDSNNVSFGNTTTYPDTTFAGTKIFSYQVGTGTVDPVLGFPLSYRNFNQIGDIQFVNNFDSDVFSWSSAQSVAVNSGLLPQNTGLTTYGYRNIWTTNLEKSKQFQIISATYDGTNSKIAVDILPDSGTTVPYLRVYVNSAALTSDQYAIVSQGLLNFVEVSTALAVGDRVDLLIYSSNVSQLGYYQVPQNLDFNTENQNFTSLTLGQLRNHLTTMAGNSNQLTGVTPGASNLRDTPIKQQGGSIVQHASPAMFCELFLVDPQANFINAIELARHEYTKIKNKFLELASRLQVVNSSDIPGLVDQVLKTINSVKNKTFPWYYSDMVPQGSNKTTTTYTIVNQEIRDYEISSLFNDTQLSNRAVLVYLNGQQLIKDLDYVFDTTRAGVTLNSSVSINVGDTLTINDYVNTDGNYIPETPTKLGLYPKFTPKIFLDNTYVTPISVIQGHDGSITPAFGDFRDDMLLEFEKRIYNNIKVNYAENLFDVYNFLPGKFRTSDYSLAEFNSLLSQSFLQWAGNNRIDFTTNSVFDSGNAFTWNYASFADTVNGELLPGTWRAVFNYFYDTDRPHIAPWEMLGFTEQPSWWQDRYGPAPYTGGNLVRGGDLEQGYIFGGSRAGIDARFARPGLSAIIPVDEYGNLRSPDQFAVANFSSNLTDLSYAVGQQGPVETAWRRSSEFPYAIQQALAVSHPAFYFGSLIDIGRYYRDSRINQFVLADTLQRITPTTIHVNGDTVNGAVYRAAGYLNWIAEALRNLGINPYTKINGYLQSVSVQLAYKMAGFSDGTLLEVLAEQSSPTSTNQGVVIPNENYDITLFKSTPTATVTYSAVIVEKSDNGYTVSGYNNQNPYFPILASVPNGNAYTISVLNDTATVYQNGLTTQTLIAYGTEFVNKQQVVDFLVSYQRYLQSVGIQFLDFDTDLNLQRDFVLSAKEFLSWSQQGWKTGSLLVVSPILNKLTFSTSQGVVDEISNQPGGSRILDTNFNFIKSSQFTVVRDNNDFSITANLGQTIALVELNVVEYEHVIVFDNVTVFNDIIYKPELGNRQYRLKLVGSKTGSWTGNLNPPGFIYNSPTVDSWTPGTDYAKGSLVVFKNVYYAALSDLAATTDFVPGQWRRLTSTELKTGLLPNFSYNAEKFKRFNDVDNPETLGDFNQYSSATIGFRPRQYLTDFGLDIPTQAKFYQGFIREKGTINAITAFTAAGFNGITSNIELYEEWGVRVGTYGALENNKFVEVVMTEGLFTGDPTTLTLLAAGQTSSDKIVGDKKGKKTKLEGIMQ